MADNTTTEVVILELQVKDSGTGKPLPEQKKDVQALATSILGLQQASKKLRDERKLLDTTTAEGTKRIDEINASLEKNDAIIKKNSTTLEKQRSNVGNYTNSIKEAIAGSGQFGQATVGLGDSFIKLLNPITGAIAAGVALFKFYTSSTAGAKDLAKAQDTLGSAFDSAKESVGDFIKELTGGGSGPGPLELAVDAILFKLSPTMAIMSKLSADAKERLRELEVSVKFAQQFAKDDERKAELQRRIRDNERATIEERVRAANQINSILENSAQRTIIVIQAQIDAIKDSTVNYDNNRAAQLKVAELETEISDKREEITGKLTENVTALAALRTQYDDEQELRTRRQIETENELMSVKQFNFEREGALLVQSEINTKESIARVGAIRLDQLRKNEKAEKDAAEKEKKIDALKNEALLGTLNMVTKEKSVARVAGTAILKKDAIQETVINTYNAAVAAYKSLAGIPYVGPFLGAAAAAAVAVFGATTVAKIAGIQFAQGGRADKQGIFSGPSHSGGGIDYVRSDGRHRINVEGDEAFFVLKKSATKEIGALSGLNQKHGGASFGHYPSIKKNYAFGGQIPTGQKTESVDQIVRAVMANMPPIYVVAQDVSEVVSRENEIKTQAQVI